MTILLDHPASHTAHRSAAPRRSIGSVIRSYSIALPLFGRAVFPMLRDKAHISLSSSFRDPQIVATYLLAVVVMIRIAGASDFFRQLNQGRAVRALFLFVVVCFASSFDSRFPLFSIWRCIEVFLLTLWAVVMIMDTDSAGDPAKAIRSFYGISLAILGGVFIGLIVNPSGAWAMEGDIARLTGTTGYSINSNDIGTIAAVMAAGCYIRAVERRSIKHIVATLLFLGMCYLSYSRASYIAAAVGFVAATAMLGRVAHRRMILFLMGSCAALSVAAVVLVSHEIRDYLTFLMTRGHHAENLESLGGRLELWEFGLRIFTNHPFLGTGYGTYPQGLEGGHFHNVLIELLVTTGIFGIVTYAAFLLTLVVAIKKSIGRSNRQAISERITAADLVTIPSVILVANGATAGAAYYSWDLLGLTSAAIVSAAYLARRAVASEQRGAPIPFSNLLR